MDAGTTGAVVLGLAAVWAALLVLLWLVRPRDVALRELVGVVRTCCSLERLRAGFTLLARLTGPG